MERLRQWVEDVRGSLWFLPTLLTLAAIVLALLTLEIDRRALAAAEDPMRWLFGGGADGARGMLGAIAGGVITVTGVIFSITIVALQLASTQYTPRVLRSFTADRGTQLTLGVLLGTFVYTLLVLRTIRGDQAGSPFIPSIAITASIVLTLISIGFVIFFIGHLARSLQAAGIVNRVASDTIESVRRAFVRRREPRGVDRGSRPGERGPASRGTGGRDVIRARDAGYVVSIDAEELLEIARSRSGTVLVEVEMGAFVLPEQPLASIRSAAPPSAAERDRTRSAIRIGRERTIDQDPLWGIVELADIAVRALSPGVNDPTTATLCIDRLAQVLVEVGWRTPPRRIGHPHGPAAVVLRPPSFDRAVAIAFDRLRHYGATDATVVRRMAEVLGGVARRVPADRRGPLIRQLELLLRHAERSVHTNVELDRILVAIGAALRGARSTAGDAVRREP